MASPPGRVKAVGAARPDAAAGSLEPDPAPMGRGWMGTRRAAAPLESLERMSRAGPAPIAGFVQARRRINRVTIAWRVVERAATDSFADPALTLIDHDPSTNGRAGGRNRYERRWAAAP
jgi:hypothetical protein